MPKNKLTPAILRTSIGTVGFCLLYSLFTLVAYNKVFWGIAFSKIAIDNFTSLLFAMTFVFATFAAHMAIVSLFAFRTILKPASILLLMLNAIALYFINTYGTPIDKDMIVNALQTDAKEVKDLLNFKMLLYLSIAGILPSIVVFKSKIVYQNFARQLLKNITVILVLALIVLMTTFIQYKQFSTFIRINKKYSHYEIPINYINGAIKASIRALRQQKLKQLGETIYIDDATINNAISKTQVVLVVGEAARAKNFSLYGYNRKTNPYLEKDNVITLSDAMSCGTSTAVSLPCIFSVFPKKDFMKDQGNYEFLPSFLAKLGIDVLWRENNFGGCKGVCENVKTDLTLDAHLPEFCSSGECWDGILAYNLGSYIKKHQGNNSFIVLHQNGSHGPLYSHRYPKDFEVFHPVCTTNEMHKCSMEELINAYDNTILYTDHLLHNVIASLKENSTVPAVMIYVSDHGESLGENGLFLHGFPYAIAPIEQKHVPFIIWMSDSFKVQHGINNYCLAALQNSSYSHDNIFHSVLGLFSIKTKYYDKNLDIFAKCRDIM